MNRGQIFVLALLAVVSLANADTLDRFCAGVPNGRFVPNPRSCQHWLFCQNGMATEGYCPGFFYFDEVMQMCRYPEYVNCNIASVDIACPIGDFELHPHPDNCEQYVACIDGFPRIINCAPGLQWDANRQICDQPHNTVCHIQEPEPEAPELTYTCIPGETYVTWHPHDCSQFIVCVNGDRRVSSCASDLVFDPANLRCDFPHNVECALPEATVDYQCDITRDFYFAPHPHSCDYFIICFAGNRQIERCAEGLIFDWMTLQCQLPINAVCLAP